jgi:hypothetical protein
VTYVSPSKYETTFHYKTQEVSTLLYMKNAVFWDVAPCRSCVNRRFWETYRLHLQGKKNTQARNQREQVAADTCSRWFLVRGFFLPWRRRRRRENFKYYILLLLFMYVYNLKIIPLFPLFFGRRKFVIWSNSNIRQYSSWLGVKMDRISELILTVPRAFASYSLWECSVVSSSWHFSTWWNRQFLGH